MKKLSVILLALLMITAFSACEDEPQGDAALTGVLYANFSYGGMYPGEIKEFPFEYSGEELNAEGLATELSELTGLDFFITASEREDGLTVDWSADSTLVAGLDGREQKEDFFFHDGYALGWFMLDSLWTTLVENLGAENIYYTMKGGEPLTAELGIFEALPKDSPYMGSSFYLERKAENEKAAFVPTKGTWRIDGDNDTAYIVMDGEGEFVMYYADGNVEAEGYLILTDEGDGTRFDMFSRSDEFICGFYFDSATQLHIGNGESDAVYILDEPNTYHDEKNGIIFTYPKDFSECQLRDNGKLDCYTLWDTGLSIWLTENTGGLSPAEFAEGLNMKEYTLLDGCAVAAHGEGKNDMGTDYPVAGYWLVKPDIIVHAVFYCSDADEAPYWYTELQNGAFSAEYVYD